MLKKRNEEKFPFRSSLYFFKAINMVLILTICLGLLFCYADSAIGQCVNCDPSGCPGDCDCDGIPDDIEINTLGTNCQVKTLFVRPKKETSNNDYEIWYDFYHVLFTDRNPNGSIDIPSFTKKNIEIMVVKTDANKPASIPNCPNCRILEIIYDTNSPWCQWGHNSYGHIYFDEYRVTWSWDTKGYTLSTGPYGYNTAYIYGIPLANYFKEGPYKLIDLDEGPEQNQNDWKYCSPLNTKDNWTPPKSYPSDICQPPDMTVEFNPFVFHSNQTIWKMPPAGTVTTKYSQDDVLRRTIIHEMGHALLAGQDTDHCADPDCIMYWGVEDWDLKSFGPGSCEHKDGGSLNIGAYGVVYNGPRKGP